MIPVLISTRFWVIRQDNSSILIENCPDCGAYGIKLFPSKHTLVVKGAGFCGVSLAGGRRHRSAPKPGGVNPDETLY